MENPETQKPTPFFQTTIAKMILIGILTLFLLIPLSYVKDLILERSQRQAEVILETSNKWGQTVDFYGPILRIPYNDPNSKKENFAYFFPEVLNNATKTTMAEPLQRSIYKSNVFITSMAFDGNYTTPNFESKNISDENIYWNRASIIIKTSNLQSLKNEVKIKFGNTNLTFEPQQNENNEFLETEFFDYNLIKKNPNFKLNFTCNGSKQIKIVPIGKTTTAKMVSNWNSPSFNGNYIPNSKTISDEGFTANWKILHFNRTFAQQHFEVLPDLNKYSFSVDFITPVDDYQQNERASKYGFLVIGLTFLIFFLIQSISKINIHIFQYSMIGLALIMFYTLLISITEHSSFSFAYAIAGSSVVALISLYSISILKNKKFPVFIGASLTTLYLFIFVIIQLEDYALLVGSIGLFFILSAVMYFSRKVDWK